MSLIPYFHSFSRMNTETSAVSYCNEPISSSSNWTGYVARKSNVLTSLRLISPMIYVLRLLFLNEWIFVWNKKKFYLCVIN